MNESLQAVNGEVSKTMQIVRECVDVRAHACGSGFLPWYAMYVKSRHEFVASGELTKKGMEAFVPSMKKVSQWKDRKKEITLPLFPGYVFVRVPAYPGAFLDVLKTRGAVAFVSLERAAPTPVDDEELQSLRLLVESGRELEMHAELKEGMRVRIKTGLLANAEGILSKQKNSYMFWINIELLGRSVSVQVSAQDLEAAA